MATSRDTQGALCLGGLRLVDVARDARIGTPSYVYDLAAIEAEARALRAAFEGAPHLIAYAVKANSAGPIVRALAALGCGADVVSGGELKVALGCGVAAEKIVYSGVAKTDDARSTARSTRASAASSRSSSRASKSSSGSTAARARRRGRPRSRSG